MIAVAALLAGLAAALAAGRSGAGGQRLAVLRPPAPSAPRSLPAGAACAVAAVAVAAVVGPPVGVLVGLAVLLAGPLALGRLEPAAGRRQREQLVREVPLLLELLSACLSGGAAPTAAAAAVAAALPGPCGRRLRAVVDSAAVGSPPGVAWLALGGDEPDDPLAAPARLLARAAEGGTPVAAAVTALAAEARAASLASGAQAARRVGVLVVAPLGLCFLPAFVLLGIVPVVAALAGPLFRGF